MITLASLVAISLGLAGASSVEEDNGSRPNFLTAPLTQRHPHHHRHVQVQQPPPNAAGRFAPSAQTFSYQPRVEPIRGEAAIGERPQPTWTHIQEVKIAEITPTAVAVEEITPIDYYDEAIVDEDTGAEVESREDDDDDNASYEMLEMSGPPIGPDSIFEPMEAFQNSRSYPVVAGQALHTKQPELIAPEETHPPNESSAPVKVIPISDYQEGSPLFPLLAGGMPSYPQELPAPVGQVPVASEVFPQPRYPVVPVAKSSKRNPPGGNNNVPAYGGYFQPAQPATLPPMGSRPNVFPVVRQPHVPVVEKVSLSPPRPGTLPPVSDTGTFPEIVFPHRRFPNSNKKLYACGGKRFITTEEEIREIKCCGTNGYKWRQMLCINGQLIDPSTASLATKMPEVLTTPKPTTKPRTTPRVKTRPPFVDFIVPGPSPLQHSYQSSRFRPQQDVQYQAVPFIQPDALPGAMLAAYHKQMARDKPRTPPRTTPRRTTRTTTTTPKPTMPPPTTTTTRRTVPTTKAATQAASPAMAQLPPKYIDQTVSNFEAIIYDPNQLANFYPEKFTPIHQFIPPYGHFMPSPPYEMMPFQFMSNPPDEAMVSFPDDFRSRPMEDQLAYGSAPVMAPKIAQETPEAPNSTTLEPDLLPSNDGRQVVMVRCNKQDWPISEPIGLYICCGDMLHYTLLDTVVCRNEIRAPVIIDEENYVRRQQLFDAFSHGPGSSQPSPRARRPLGFVPFVAPPGSASVSFCENADPTKFCCGQALYEKEFGQVCCDGNYGFSKAGKTHCCDATPFDIATHECSEARKVVPKTPKPISYFS